MDAKYCALDISKYIINKCTTENMPISNLQLQKILYYIQKDYIKRNSLLFSDDIEAWQFGPVVPNVYYQFCGHGAMKIKLNYNINIAECDKKIINNIVNKKRNLNAWDLVEETHKPGGAWDKTFCNGSGNHNVIDIDLIKRFG